MKKAKNTLGLSAARRAAAAACCLIFILMLAMPARSISGARDGLALCGGTLIPSLFPLLALSEFVTGTGLAAALGRVLERPVKRLFGLPGPAAAAMALGLIGGYPVGARACAGLCRSGELSRGEAERLLSFCVNSSPAFIIGGVGAGMLGSPAAGAVLYAAHISASLVLGLLCRARAAKSGEHPRRTGGGTAARPAAAKPLSALFVSSVSGSASVTVDICAFVVLFSSLCALLPGGPQGSLPAAVSAAAKCLLEVSNGCAAASCLPAPAVLPAISACLSWSGLCVICQVSGAVRDAGLNIGRYVRARFIHMAVSVPVCAAAAALWPGCAARAVLACAAPLPAFHTAQSSAALLMLCSMLLLSMLKV